MKQHRKKQIDATVRRLVFQRDELLCQTCGLKTVLTRDIRTEEDYKNEALIEIYDRTAGGLDSYRTICRSCTALVPEIHNPSEVKFLSLERGEYTRVHNNILYALARVRLNSEESRVINALIAKTYGFNQSEDFISFSQLQSITGISRSHCSRTVTRLITRRIVLRLGKKLKLNKYHFQWLGAEVLPKQVQKVAQIGNKVLPEQATTKDTTKRHIKNNTAKDIFKTNISAEDWRELIDSFKTLNPVYEEFYYKKPQRDALNYLADKIGLQKLKGLLKALPTIVSQKFAPKITTPFELKRDIGKLILHMKQNQGSSSKGQTITKENAHEYAN